MNEGPTRDLVVGCMTNYGLDQIRPWVMSLEACGFQGDKAMIVYNADFSVVENLVDRGFLVVTFEQEYSSHQYRFQDSVGEQILVSRFFHIWCLLSDPIGLGYRYVISADVKDVIFQTNPSRWLEQHLGDKLLNVGSESVRFQDEPWGNGVMAGAFEGTLHEYMKPRTIYNAGTMAGTSAAMRDFALQVYLAAAGRLECPDQASANILLSLEPFRSVTRFNTSEDGWACQAGTSVAASYVTGRTLPLLEPSPVFDGSEVLTNAGAPFCLIHQYDRVPEWSDAFLRKYSANSERSTKKNRGMIVAHPEWRLTGTR